MFNESSTNNTIYSKDFKASAEDNCIEHFAFSYSNYQMDGTEGPLIVMIRDMQIFLTIRHSFEDLNKTTYTSKFKNEVLTPKQVQEERLQEFKNIFLLNVYKNEQQAIKIDDIPETIKFYSDKWHPSLAKFVGFNLYDPNGEEAPCILTERPVNGSLRTYFSSLNFAEEQVKISETGMYINESYQNPSELTCKQKFILIIGIVSGIEFIHRNGKVHGHLNPTTIYLDEKLHPLICGYGFIYPLEDDYNGEVEIVNSAYTNISYIAPEVFDNRIYQASDIFSIGMIIYYILTGLNPFQGMSVTAQQAKIASGQLPGFPAEVNEYWQQFIINCCNLEPSKRPKASALLSNLLTDENIKKLVLSIEKPDDEFNPDYDPQFSTDENRYIQDVKSSFKFDESLDDCDILREMIPDPTVISHETKEIIDKANKNDPDALETLGLYFLKGENNIPKIEENGFELIKAAADQGFASSIVLVAKLYAKGIGTDVNPEKAIEYYTKALPFYDNNEIEKANINKKIDKIKADMDNVPQLMKDIHNKDKAAGKLREAQRMQIRLRQVVINNIPNNATEADILKLFSGYQDIVIIFNYRANFSAAKVIMKTHEDKIDFEEHCRENKNIKIRNKDIKIDLPPTPQEIIKKRNKNWNKIKKCAKDPNVLRKMKREMNKKIETKNEPKIASTQPLKSPQNVIDDTTYPTPHNSDDDGDTKSEIVLNFDDYYPGEGISAYKKFANGSYGDTYKVYRKADKKLFIAKVFKNSFKDSKDRKNFKREITALATLDSPLVIKLIGYSKMSIVNPKLKLPTMIMEFATNGTLTDMIAKKPAGVWTNTTKIKTILGITRAMSYIHGRSFIHRDLKPDNIFFDSENEVKIGDFGCSRNFDSSNQVIMTFNVGTPIYCAPEVLEGESSSYTWSVDVFSFGIILFQILTDTPIDKIYKFRSLAKFCDKIMHEKLRPKIPPEVNENMKYLMEICWSNSIDNRPSFNIIFSTLKANFESDSPDPFLPDVDIQQIRDYLKKLDTYPF